MKHWEGIGHPRNVDDEYASEWGSSQVLTDEVQVPTETQVRWTLATALKVLWAILRGQ